jgi:hypothetical protein
MRRPHPRPALPCGHPPGEDGKRIRSADRAPVVGVERLAIQTEARAAKLHHSLLAVLQ